MKGAGEGGGGSNDEWSYSTVSRLLIIYPLSTPENRKRIDIIHYYSVQKQEAYTLNYDYCSVQTQQGYTLNCDYCSVQK